MRPSVQSLNSLARVLSRAKPLYTECRLILNYLDDATEARPLAQIDALEGTDLRLAVNKDTPTIHRTVLEPEPIARESLDPESAYSQREPVTRNTIM